ncbi:helix-turn-helix domain-containing protein [Bradyrhizobium sp.]|uniref:helix-turn-helix domain-containing protein n=1 Tax=Bradyrhizobium sp. TaxID=376 RepID=UPI002D4E2977|nr:helix-turn-helix domain-containing protein [Bradyrhizobium sp.]HZR73055.1 helix-turn-helix domain-containing protein [Bradyrhizobium sp.]
MRVRLKADGRLVEILHDGSERPIAAGVSAAPATQADYARKVRMATGLTQAAFAARIKVPLETVRNWEQGKRSPRGPARTLLKLIEMAPESVFAALDAA